MWFVQVTLVLFLVRTINTKFVYLLGSCKLTIIIIITCIYNAPFPKDSKRRIILTLVTGPISFILIIFLSSLGSIQPIMCNLFGATGLIKHNNLSLPSQVPIYTPGWREAITVKCLAQGHKHHGCSQDSNPHSDDSAIRTQIWCTKPLGHSTPQLISTF